MRRYCLDGLPRLPLSDDDQDCLKTVHRTRRQVFFAAVIPLVILAWITTGPISVDGGNTTEIRRKTYLGHVRTRPWYYTEHWPTTLNQLLITEKVFVLGMLLIPGYAIYRKRIAPLSRDLAAGEKARVLYTITGKREFPHTRQYFLLLDDPDRMSQEVPKELYERARPGDKWPSYIAPNSRYVFDPSGRFELM